MVNKILGLLGWLGVALVLSAVAVRFLQPEWRATYNALAIAGLACTLLYLVSQWREVAQSFSGRQAKFGAVALGGVLAIVAILAAVNYIASRQNKRWDLTANRVFSLSEQTHKLLGSLVSPVQVRVFARSDDFQRFRDRLAEYANASSQLSVEYIDLDQKPALANQYQVQSYGTVVFEHEGRVERAVSDGEQELTNALIKVVQGTQKKVYFVQGHGEKDPASAERGGYNTAKAALESDNFTVETLPLVQQAGVPDDATVVAIAGPRTDYLEPEIDALRRYLNRGGKVLVLIDPPDTADAPPLSRLAALLEEWAIQPGNDVVVDASGMGRLIGTDASVPVALSYPPHPITENFRVLTAYPLARSMSPVTGGANGRYAQAIIETGPRSWAETDVRTLTTSGEVELQEDKGDKPGPVTIGAAVSVAAPEPPAAAGDVKPPSGGEDAPGAAPAADQPKPETRLAAIGDSDFAANLAIGVQGNRDLFLNVVNWLAQQENLIAIRPREPDDRRITVTAEQQTMVFWLSVVLIPGLLLAAGVRAWWSRR